MAAWRASEARKVGMCLVERLCHVTLVETEPPFGVGSWGNNGSAGNTVSVEDNGRKRIVLNSTAPEC